MKEHYIKAIDVNATLARGTIALAYLAEIAEYVADYDMSKAAADAIYAGKINDATAALSSRIAGATHRATAALETVGTPDDDIDDDDDD